MNQPLVSVIVPVYNRAASIGECVQSILAQEVTDLELIVVDDGSTDSTPEVLDALAAADARVRLVRQANAGVSAARNLGLSLARGKWIAFVDSDDVVSPAHLNLIVQEDRPGIDLLVTTEIGLRLRGGRVVLPQTAASQREEAASAAHYMLNAYNPWRNPLYSIEDKFFRRALIEAHALRFDETMSLGEDQVFLMAYLQHAGGVVRSTRPTYFMLDWTGLDHLGSKLRTPADFLYNQRRGYEALSAIIPLAGGGDALCG